MNKWCLRLAPLIYVVVLIVAREPLWINVVYLLVAVTLIYLYWVVPVLRWLDAHRADDGVYTFEWEKHWHWRERNRSDDE